MVKPSPEMKRWCQPSGMETTNVAAARNSAAADISALGAGALSYSASCFSGCSGLYISRLQSSHAHRDHHRRPGSRHRGAALVGLDAAAHAAAAGQPVSGADVYVRAPPAGALAPLRAPRSAAAVRSVRLSAWTVVAPVPNRLTAVPSGPAPELGGVARRVRPVADAFMVAMISRPPSGTLATTWVTPATLGLAAGSVVAACAL